MRTALIVLGGFVLWAVCLGVAKLSGAMSYTTATVAFAVLWFIAAAINMYIGVTKAGYGFMEELPIFLLIFLVPAIVAIVVRWKLLG